jgi:hypothetical protein
MQGCANQSLHLLIMCRYQRVKPGVFLYGLGKEKGCHGSYNSSGMPTTVPATDRCQGLTDIRQTLHVTMTACQASVQ